MPKGCGTQILHFVQESYSYFYNLPATLRLFFAHQMSTLQPFLIKSSRNRPTVKLNLPLEYFPYRSVHSQQMPFEFLKKLTPFL